MKGRSLGVPSFRSILGRQRQKESEVGLCFASALPPSQSSSPRKEMWFHWSQHLRRKGLLCHMIPFPLLNWISGFASRKTSRPSGPCSSLFLTFVPRLKSRSNLRSVLRSCESALWTVQTNRLADEWWWADSITTILIINVTFAIAMCQKRGESVSLSKYAF